MTQSPSLPGGTNVRLLFHRCKCEDSYLFKAEATSPLISRSIEDVGLVDLTHAGHTFEEGGYTLAHVLAESHVIIHTWPEHDRLVLVEISVCDFMRPNRERAVHLGQKLAELFQPTWSLDEITSMNPRLSEENIPGNGYYVDVDSLITTRRSAYQNIVIANTKAFGKTLVLDGTFQTTERDNCFYHEPLVHLPMLSHSNPESVLICGGGDGGAVREVLKHPSVQNCLIVDIDPEVVTLAKEELPEIHQGALNDPRVRIKIQDAAKFVKDSGKEFDVILMDSTDPVGCGEVLFTEEFYQDVMNCLSRQGWLGLHVGAPLCIEETSKKIVQTVSHIFENVYPYLHFVPSYGSMMGFLLCSNGDQELISRRELIRRMEERELTDLQIISSDTFYSLFSIPPILKNVFPMRVSAAVLD